jgi:hypothetical protein
MPKDFSLTIRADDGSTMLQTNVDYIHQAFQRLIDWSIGAITQDFCAIINGPNGFCLNHRIKALTGFCLDSKRESELTGDGNSLERAILRRQNGSPFRAC